MPSRGEYGWAKGQFRHTDLHKNVAKTLCITVRSKPHVFVVLFEDLVPQRVGNMFVQHVTA